MAESLDMSAVRELYRNAALALESCQYDSNALNLGDAHDYGDANEELLGDCEAHEVVVRLRANIAHLYSANTVTLRSGV
jgi:hypothetical protein